MISNIYEYMRENAPLLGEKILEMFPPLQGATDPISPLMSDLLRQPLPAQALAIQGISKFLENDDAAKIVGECGTGKTLMGLGATYVHAEGKPYTALLMVPPHITLKWAREAFLTIPNSRVYLIEDMRNGGDPNKAHGVVEVQLVDGEARRRGEQFSLSHLRSMKRSEWIKSHPYPTFFIMGKDKGKLGYFWRHAFVTGKSGAKMGCPLNPDTYQMVENQGEDGGYYYQSDFAKQRISEVTERPNKGTKVYSPLWSADISKIQRMAPVEFVGRYLKKWFDYAIADELHQLGGDTAQGNALASITKASRKQLGLTGTFLGGYADDCYNLLYRLDAPQMAREGFQWGSSGRMDFVRKYGVLETTTEYQEEDNACSKKSKAKTKVKRKPGASPEMFGRFLMANTCFVNLEDISSSLPKYDEEVIEVEMPAEMETAYDYLSTQFKDAIREHGKGGSIISTMLNTLLLYPDHPFDIGQITARVFNEETHDFERVWIADAPELAKTVLYPKEERLLEEVKSEIAAGRRCQIFVTYTGEHSMLHRLQTILQNEGLRSAVLESTVPTEKREAWYHKQVKGGVQVVICHPKLVETGLDLLDFPTLVFYETGYSIHTLRQASRRSWRIGQKHAVRVLFLYYKNTFQERCVQHMGKKMLVAMAMEGKFSGEGLNAMGDEDMMTSLARELVEQGGVGESANQIWRDLRGLREKLLTEASPVVPVVAVAVTHRAGSAHLSEVFDDVAIESMEVVSPDVSLQIVEPADSQAAFSGLLQFAFRPAKKRRAAAVEETEQMLLFA
jgi:superfamily II DNA or RNA helicase